MYTAKNATDLLKVPIYLFVAIRQFVEAQQVQ